MSRRGSLPVLRHRGFAAFFAAASISNSAAWMQTIAVPALLFDLTGKATWLGISALATLVPQVIISPYAGVLADRVSRRLILLITQIVSMLVTFGLWGMYVADALTPWRIVFLGFLAGLAGGFQNSTWQAFIPLLVPRSEMLDAVKLNTVQFTLARSLGPMIAGLVLARWGSGVAIFVNATTYLLVIAVLLILRPRETATLAPEVKVFRALGDGARFVWQNLPLRTAVVAAFLSAACGQSMQSQAAAISRRVFGHASKDSAWLLTALGTGALLSFVGWTILGERLRRSRQILLGQVGFAVSALVIASSSSFTIGLLGYAIGGFSHLTNSVGINTLIQGEIPDAMRGRMMSFYLMGIIGGIPVGAYFLGWVGDAFGMRWALLGNAGLLVLALAWLWGRGWLASMDITTMSGHRMDGSTAPAR